MSRDYHNEFDPFAAQWLRNLIAEGLLPPGDVDERSIVDVRPSDLAGYTRCHFFSGIGGWPLALRLAGWPDDRPVWTGSCPCQPFSAAGRGRAEEDERHLWPVWSRLIKECRPSVIFGEQVASSLVTGSTSSAALPDLFGREAIGRILREFEGSATGILQGMRAGEGARAEAGEACDRADASQAMARRKARFRAGERGQAPRKNAGHTVHAGPSGYPEADRSWPMRNDWDRVRPDDAPLLERSVAGPDRAWARVHSRERQGGAVCPERDGEHVGAGGNIDGGLGDSEDAGDESGERILADLAGEHAEGAPGRPWIDLVQDDLEGMGYAFGAVPLPAASVGAPHIRDRLWWVADADGGHAGSERQQPGGEHGQQPADRTSRELAYAMPAGWSERRPSPGDGQTAWSGGAGELADAGRTGRGALQRAAAKDGRETLQFDGHGDAGFMGHAGSARLALGSVAEDERGTVRLEGPAAGATEPLRNPWSDAEWIWCRDGKHRPTQPGLFPLAHGVPGRVGKLRAYGNAIVPQVAAGFIRAYLECRSDHP